ncbi:MAG: tRNA uridine-5-carboxymethylaminomethyl(34) synthesis GTPase MnmE [Magnetococcus sp. YQC-5]
MRSPLSLESEPIAGLATPHGTSALAIIRLSGTGLRECLLPLLRRPDGRPASLSDFTPRILKRMDLVETHEYGHKPLDKAMLVFFPAPHSYTGEDLIELHCHGSPVVIQHVLTHLTELGIRPAKPGEFTRRACLNGKMDLTQAEALISLINAASLRGAREALRQMEGSLSQRVFKIRERVLKILAQMEATLDFADEVTDPLLPRILLMELSGVSEQLGELLRTSTLGTHFHDGFQLLIAGRPNVGKSSLFNRLLGRQRAIVSPLPGTTRDCIDSRMEIQGISVLLIDTAGLRDTSEVIELEGIKLTKERLTQADGVLLVLDPQQGATEDDLDLLRLLPPEQVIAVWNKMDLFDGSHAALQGWQGLPTVTISCLTGEGLDALLTAIAGLFLPMPVDGEGAVIMAARQKNALAQAVRSLAECESMIVHNQPLEVATLPLRAALEALGEMVGQITHEALLDQIFGTFCIGK